MILRGIEIKMVNTFLDLYDLFFNVIAGTGNIAILMSLLIIFLLFIMAYFRFPNSVTFPILMVFALMMSAFFPITLGIVFLIIGMLSAWTFGRIIKV